MRDILKIFLVGVVGLPLTVGVMFLAFWVLALVFRLLLVGAPIVAVGGVIIFVCQMLENRSH